MASEALKVTKENIFEVMIRQHYQNLQSSLPFFKESQIYDRNGNPLEEGVSENPYYTGMYLVYDGEKVLQTASERIMRKKGIRDTVDAPTADQLFRSIANEKDQDVVCAYNTKTGQLTTIKGEFSTSHSGGDLDGLIEKNIPEDFLSSNGSVPVYDCGTKTSNAMLTAYALNEKEDRGVKTIIIKRTAYDLGMGKVAEFGKDGLTREFFFKYDPEHTGAFIDEQRSIVGVYREYHRVAGELVPKSEKYVSLGAEGKIQYHEQLFSHGFSPASSSSPQYSRTFGN